MLKDKKHTHTEWKHTPEHDNKIHITFTLRIKDIREKKS